MANQIVTLKDDNNNPTFPIAGGMAENSITTQMLKDGSVTSDKIDWTTLGSLELNNVTTSANGNIPTTIPVATAVPISANCNDNNAVPSFYVPANQSNWTLHLSAVASGGALANTTIQKIVIRYLP